MSNPKLSVSFWDNFSAQKESKDLTGSRIDQYNWRNVFKADIEQNSAAFKMMVDDIKASFSSKEDALKELKKGGYTSKTLGKLAIRNFHNSWFIFTTDSVRMCDAGQRSAYKIVGRIKS